MHRLDGCVLDDGIAKHLLFDLCFSRHLPIPVDRIGFSFGPKNGDFTKSWNLGNDINGENSFPLRNVTNYMGTLR